MDKERHYGIINDTLNLEIENIMVSKFIRYY